MSKKPAIIFEDDSIVLVNKAPKFLTIPDRYASHIPNVYTQLKSRYENIFIVHRLDRETSGILVFAKTAKAHKNLCLQFDRRAVKKIYYTLVEGVLHTKKRSYR